MRQNIDASFQKSQDLNLEINAKNTDPLSDKDSVSDVEDSVSCGSEGEDFVDLQRMFRMKRVFNRLKNNKINYDNKMGMANKYRLRKVFYLILKIKDPIAKLKFAMMKSQKQDKLLFNQDGVQDTPTNQNVFLKFQKNFKKKSIVVQKLLYEAKKKRLDAKWKDIYQIKKIQERFENKKIKIHKYNYSLDSRV